MRVLHIDSGREMRGGQWQVLRLVQALAEAGHGVPLVCPAGSPLFRNAKLRGLDVQPLGLKAFARNVELVHVHDARSHTLAAFLARAPLVVSRRVAFPIKQNLASRWKYRAAAQYIAVSQFVK